MHDFALVLILLSGVTPPQQVKESGIIVALEGRSITLPRLPLDSREDRTRFKEIHAQIGTAQEDLAQSLGALYGKPEAKLPLPKEITVQQEDVPEVRALLAVIGDAEFGRLERAYLDTWKGWQAALVEGGVAKRLHAFSGTTKPQSPQYEETRRKGLLALQAPSRRLQRVTRSEAAYRSNNENDDFPEERTRELRMRPEELSVEVGQLSEKENDAQNRKALANVILPDLVGTWNPLVLHLNVRAQNVLDQGWSLPTPGHPTQNILRVHAQLAVLERFRKALYYCDLVWCQMAGVEAPPPPRKVGR